MFCRPCLGPCWHYLGFYAPEIRNLLCIEHSLAGFVTQCLCASHAKLVPEVAESYFFSWDIASATWQSASM